MKKQNSILRVLFATAVLMGSDGLCAQVQQEEQQSGGFTKQIEVQKEYEVTVRSAERIESEVRLLDTTIVRPELSYRISPTAHHTTFRSRQIKPIDISTARWERPRNLYLSVGAGLPLASEVDLYATPSIGSRQSLTLWLNHEGNYGNVTNWDNRRIGGSLMRNRAGVDYNLAIGNLTTLSTSVKYRGSVGAAYGGVGVAEDAARPTVSVHDLEASARLAGRFNATSPLSYEANLMGLYAFNNRDENVWRFNVNYGLRGLQSYSPLLPTLVTFHYSGVQSTCREPYYDTSVTFVPEWNFRIGEWVPVDIMAGYDYMVYRGANNNLNGVISSIGVSFDRYRFAIPYLTVANDVQTKVTRDGLWNNPYMAMLPVDSRKIFLAELGVKGDVAGVSYSLSGATRWFSAYLFEKVVEGSPLLDYGRSNGQRVWYAKAEALWRPNRWWSLEGRVTYTALGKAQSRTADFRPRNWNGMMAVRYTPTTRLSFGLSATAASAMPLTLESLGGEQSTIVMPSYVDLAFEADYQYTSRVALWLRGDNLLSQPIYHWATYRAPGATVTLGARMSF